MIEYVGADGSQFELDAPVEGSGAAGTAVKELTFAESIAQMDAAGQAVAALRKKTDEKSDESDPDEMRRVPNRQMRRDAMNLRGSTQANRSRVRRKIHRILTKKGYWS